MTKSIDINFIKKHTTSLIQISLVLIMALPLIYPLGLPIAISNHPRDFYNYVENLEPGSKILIELGLSVGTLGETLGSCVAFCHQAMSKGLKLYFVGISTADGVVLIFDKYLMAGAEPSNYGYVYGEDYCNLGYIPGGDVAYSAFARECKSAVLEDNYGTPIENIPMMKDMQSINDFDVVMLMGEYHQRMAQLWTVPYNKPQISIGFQLHITRDLEPFYQAGVIKEYLGGSIHGAEYEALVGKPGRALATIDSISLSHLLIIIYFSIGNILYLIKRGEKLR